MKSFGVIFDKGEYLCSDWFRTKSMLDAYKHETDSILGTIYNNVNAAAAFQYGASCGIRASSNSRGEIHDVYRAALQAALDLGHLTVPYQDTEVASLDAKVV